MKFLTNKLIRAFTVIPLPGVLPARTPSKMPRTFPRIKSELDLPRYLIFGELQPQSFKLRDHSWSANWGADPHSGQLGCEYDSAKSSMLLTATWRGLRGPMHAGRIDSPTEFRQAVIRLFTVLKDYEIPPSWKDKLAVMAVPALVRSIYPVTYKPDEYECREMFEIGFRDMGGLPLEYPMVTTAIPAGSDEAEPAVVIQLLSYVLVSITPFAGLFDVIDAWESNLPGPMLRLPQRTPFVVTAMPPFFRKPWVGSSGASTEWTFPAFDNLAPMLQAFSTAPSAGEAIAQIKAIRKVAAKFNAVAERFLDEESDD